nr:hypothetical protein [Tanacetum cinerariifolium]
MIVASVEKGPLVWPTIAVDGETRLKEYTELTAAKTTQADCDIKAINIILQGIPPEIYELEYYLRFTLLLNDMNIYKMPLEKFQVNSKSLNTLPSEWSKFVTDVKLVKDLHTTNVDQLHAYLDQHERHANEVRLTRECSLDPFDFVENHQMTHLNNTQSISHNNLITYPLNEYQSSVHHNVYSPQSSIPYLEYAPAVNQQQQQPEFSLLESGLIVLVFKQGNSSRVSGSNTGKQRVVICYNCKGEGHMSKQCTKPKKPTDNTWFKDIVLLTVHMLRKPKFFYDHTTKQALGFQNPIYLKKAQQLEPKLYDGNVIKNTYAIMIPDSEETLMLAKESRSKMLLKQQDPMNYMNSSDPSPSCTPTRVEVPKELPKVSMVNTSLKKLKHHLAGFEVVVKERTTTTAITEGSWGFEHTKACFRDEVIPFVKALKDIFNTFDQHLIDELTKV